MDINNLIFWAGAVIQGLLVYIFFDTKKVIFDKIAHNSTKLRELEKGEFVERLVKQVIYAPESRSYFKSIFTEVLNHKDKNDNSVLLSVLDHLESIAKKMK